MSRKKMPKIEGFNLLPNAVNNDTQWKGRWQERFGNDHPITIELGCGKGDLSLGLARLHPERNFIGVDIKGVRLFTGAKAGVEEGLDNLQFLRCDIRGIGMFFGENEAQSIWVTFPDPFPKKGQTRNRLTQEVFLAQYARILHPEGQLFFKTDNTSLFSFTLDHLKELNEREILKVGEITMTRDLHHSELLDEDNRHITDYERRFLDMGKPICYLRCTLQPGPNIGLVPATEKVALATDEKAPRVH